MRWENPTKVVETLTDEHLDFMIVVWYSQPTLRKDRRTLMNTFSIIFNDYRPRIAPAGSGGVALSYCAYCP